MPLSSSDITTYHLDYTDGRFAVLGAGDPPMVSLLPVQLIAINESRRSGNKATKIPVFVLPGLGDQGNREHTIDPTAILFEPNELPADLRDLLWPREVPAEFVVPVSPPIAPLLDPGNIDDDPVPAGSSDYDGPAF